MKIVFFTTYYKPFLNHFCQSISDIHSLSFDQLQTKILDCYFADTGAALHYSRLAGQEAHIIIANFEILQKKWAQENNFNYDKKNWQQQIALEQVKTIKPDVFFTENVFSFGGEFITEVNKHAKKSAAWISCPFDLVDLKGISLVLTSTMAYKKQFNSQGINSEYLLPAFDKRVLDKIKTGTQPIPVSFIGGISPDHINRFEALNYIADKVPLYMKGYGLPEKNKGLRSLFRKDIFKSIRKVHHGEAWGLDMYQELANSKMTFNIHESLLKGDVGNMRMFEATGVGTLLINDFGNNLSQIFEPEKEIVTYKSLPEAVEKINYYLAHPTEAAQIAIKGQDKTLTTYNYEIYNSKLLHYFSQLF